MSQFKWRQELVKTHNEKFDALSISEQMRLERESAKQQDIRLAKKYKVFQDACESVCTAREATQETSSTAADDGIANKVTSFRLSPEALKTATELFNQVHRHDDELQWRDWGGAPDLIPEEILDELDGAMEHRQKVGLVAWQRMLIHHRDDFVGCAIYAGDGDPTESIYMPMSVAQSPQSICWLHLRRKTLALPALDEWVAGYNPRLANLLVQYDFYDLTFRMDDFGFRPGESLWVLPGFIATEGTTLETCCTAVPFDVYSRFYAVPRQDTQRVVSRPVANARAIIQQLRDLYPWLTDSDLGLAPRGNHRGSHRREVAPSSDGAVAPPDGEVSVEAEGVEPLLAQMREERAEWLIKKDSEQLLFYKHLRGGAWTARELGVANSTATMYARKKRIAQDFCSSYKFPKEKSFSISLYDMEPANMLADEWVHMGNYYVSIWIEHECDGFFRFSDDQIDGANTRGFLEWFGTLDASDVHYVVACELLEFRPRC